MQLHCPLHMFNMMFESGTTSWPETFCVLSMQLLLCQSPVCPTQLRLLMVEMTM